MFILLLVKEFLEDIKKQKMRAFLTTMAITWGTLAIILLMAFGEGLSFKMREGLLNAGDMIIRCYSGQTSQKYQGMPIGRRILLTEQDAKVIEENIPQVDVAAPGLGRHVRLKRGDKIVSTYMEGVYPEFEFLRRLFPAEGGRFLNEKDLTERRRSLFLGGEIAKELFPEVNPVGQILTLDGMPFTIVGMMPDKFQNSMNNGPDDRRAIIPFSTYQSIYGDKYINELIVKPIHASDGKFVEQEIRRVLGRKYRFNAEDEEAVHVWNFIEIEEQSSKVFKGINIFLGVIGFMSLVIAGVGVANIMYVVVKERTREIGIKRAIGAKRRHILFQIIFESLFISVIGGGFGLFFSFIIVKGVWLIPAEEGPMEFLGRPLLSHAVVLLAVGILTAIGLLAGFFPARKAASADPIESLRYE